MRLRITAMAIATAIALGGCASMSTTEQRTLSGAGIGALGGAAIGAVTGGDAGTGAAIGAAVGAGAGYLYDRSRNGR